MKVYIDEIHFEVTRLKLSTCIVMFRNLLNRSPNKIIDTVEISKQDKLKTFDKIYAETLVHCIKNIKESECEAQL